MYLIEENRQLKEQRKICAAREESMALQSRRISILREEMNRLIKNKKN